MNFLKSKFGPLPMWAYLAGAALIAGYLIYRQRKTSAASATSGTDTTGTQADTGTETATGADSGGVTAGNGSYGGGGLSDTTAANLTDAISALTTTIADLGTGGAAPLPSISPGLVTTSTGVPPITPTTVSVPTPGATHGLVPTTTKVSTPAPKPATTKPVSTTTTKKKPTTPISGYAQASHANLH